MRPHVAINAEFESQLVDIIAQCFHPMRETGRIGIDFAGFIVALSDCPAIVNVHDIIPHVEPAVISRVLFNLSLSHAR